MNEGPGNSGSETSSSPGEAGTTEYQAKRETERQAAVMALTAAARLRHPQYGRLDFAEFAADVLASVAANVGGVDRLLTSRPGSWEADKVGDLLYSTVGYDEEYLIRHRTEPVVIHLNVHRLMGHNSKSFVSPCEQELEQVGQRYAALSDEEYTDASYAAEQGEYATIRATWAARYAAYAEAFTAAVQAEVARIDGLQVPVMVEAVTDADPDVDDSPAHPDDVDFDDPAFDPLAVRLWEVAVAAVSLPPGTPEGGQRGE